jgi:hypothetical protein
VLIASGFASGSDYTGELDGKMFSGSTGVMRKKLLEKMNAYPKKAGPDVASRSLNVLKTS